MVLVEAREGGASARLHGAAFIEDKGDVERGWLRGLRVCWSVGHGEHLL
ncbi:MAG: hypothetical protein L6Q34_06180 [Nitrospira sp.]|nr:hypothetical protein [Nitrospira sp.]MEB2338348.1 hypothetical protein [Nitrospirales bacterium]